MLYLIFFYTYTDLWILLQDTHISCLLFNTVLYLTRYRKCHDSLPPVFCDFHLQTNEQYNNQCIHSKEDYNMLENNNDQLITLEELQELLNIGRSTAYSLLNSGEIKAFRIGRFWKIPRASVTEFVARKSKLSVFQQ